MPRLLEPCYQRKAGGDFGPRRHVCRSARPSVRLRPICGSLPPRAPLALAASSPHQRPRPFHDECANLSAALSRGVMLRRASHIRNDLARFHCAKEKIFFCIHKRSLSTKNNSARSSVPCLTSQTPPRVTAGKNTSRRQTIVDSPSAARAAGVHPSPPCLSSPSAHCRPQGGDTQ